MQLSSRLGQTIRSLSSRFAGKALVLQYHRVAELAFDPYALCVTPQHFAEHLTVLRSMGRPTSLKECCRALQAGKLTRRALIVTFDDGYLDCLYAAKPVLERNDFPATVFVVSGSVGSNQEFWWDELESLLLHPGRLPGDLQLVIDGDRHHWTLDAAAEYSSEDFERNIRWHYGRPDDPTSRHRLFRLLYGLLQPLPPPQRLSLLMELRTWAGAAPANRPTHRPLSTEELIRLAEGDLVEVGAHTVTHPMLSGLPVGNQREEIQQSKVQLEKTLGSPVSSFSYPHGLPRHYTDATATIVQESGFSCACSSVAGSIKRGTDPFQLPRLVIHDWDGETFERKMKQWIRD